MNELFEQVLNDAASRDISVMPSLASNIAEKFQPWAGGGQDN